MVEEGLLELKAPDVYAQGTTVKADELVVVFPLLDDTPAYILYLN